MPLILLVDDDDIFRIVAPEWLAPLGEVITARNVPEYRRVVAGIPAGQAIDVAVVDLHMQTDAGPDQDAGFAVIEDLEKRFPAIRSVVISVRGDEEAQRRAKSTKSVRYYFHRPYSPNRFGQAVRLCLEEKPAPDGKVPPVVFVL